MDIQYPEGATPISADELDGLIPEFQWQHELNELNELERDNILAGYRWAQKSRKLKRELLSVHGVKLLHRKMFSEVWKWAGTFRTTEKNVGSVLAHHVSEEVHKLCDDVRYRMQENSVTWKTPDWQECAVWCHHRMVSIHPFPNGNGRHARMFADLFLVYNQQKPLPWGKSSLISNDEIRKKYISALRKADAGNLKPLVAFACDATS